MILLVDPAVLGGLPGGQLLGLEPQSNLLLGRLHGVGPVADVASNLNKRIFLSFMLNALGTGDNIDYSLSLGTHLRSLS